MKPKFIIILILVLLAVIFVIQNSAMVKIELFFWSISMNQIIMILGLLLVGFLIGFLVTRK
ncbi:MAG: LapA family protein [Candidatus Aminicenantaceae bacterium]